MRTLSLALAAACLLASPASAQTPSPPVVMPPVLISPAPQKPRPLPETWEDIPPAIRQRLERELKPLAFQSVLKIGPAELPSDARMVEAGSMIASQRVTPARGVRLTSAPRRAAYGAVGSVLWQARDGLGDLWCLRGTNSVFGIGRYYCYRDTNADGTFDQLYESTFYGADPGFQPQTLGVDEDIKKPVTYEPSDPPPLEEIVGLRYHGLQAGLIAEDGEIRPGMVQVELVVGGALRVLKTYDVGLDRMGRGRLRLSTGHEVVIDKVEVGGRARIKVTGGLTPGEGYLFPPATRESLLKRYREALQAPPVVAPRPSIMPPIEAAPKPK